MRPTAAGAAGARCSSRSRPATSSTRSTRHRHGPGRAAQRGSSAAILDARGTRGARRSTRGRTSPPPTTAPTSGSTSTAIQVGDPRRRPGAMPTSTGAAADRRQQHLGRVVRRPDRRGARLQPRAHRGRDPGRHEHAGRPAAADGHRAADRARRTSRRPAGLSSVSLTWTAATRQRRRRPLQRPPRARRRASRRARPTASRSPRATSYTDAGLAPGTYYYRVIAEDAAGNVSAGLERGERRRHGRLDAADARPASLRRPGPSARPASTWTAADATTWASSATTSTAPPSHGFDARARQPDRAADRHELHRHRPRGGHLLLPRHRGGRGRKLGAALERGDRDRDLRHDGADRRRHGARRRRDGLRHGRRCRRPLPTTSASRASSSRLDGANLGAADTTAPYAASWDTDDRDGRPAHAPRRRERRGRQLDDLGARHGHGRQQHAAAAVRPRRRVRLQRRHRHDARGRDREGAHGHDLRCGLVDRGHSTAARSPSTASTTGSRSPTQPISTSRTG